MEPVDGAATPLIERYRLHLTAAALVAFAFIQQPGRIVGDTKADLVIDPARFLRQALSVWDAQQGFGQLGNQSYGYLFPMGPFFLLGHVCGLPSWFVQRLWWASLLLVGYYGMQRVAATLGIGTAGSRIVGSLAYVLAPRVLTVLGGISVEAWPGAVLPWVLLPLVLAMDSRLPARRAATLSGIAIVAMGAVNAAATVAALAVPAGYLLVASFRPLGRRLLAWWILATTLAALWWAGPLLILGRYAFPFLDYIENAATTTATTGVLNTIRGVEHWGGYLLVGGVPRWPSGYQLAYGLLPFLCTCLLAGVGLAGLCRASMPDARWLRVCAGVGVVLISAGHTGTLGGGAADAVQSALDGSLAAFRNIHKFDPMLRLPISLGVAHAVGLLLGADRRAVRSGPRPAGANTRFMLAVPSPAATALGVALLALAGSVLPAVQSGVSPPGSYNRVPAYWGQVADWLAARSSAGSALLVPSSNFAVYNWGSPEDEPLQALARSAWEVRDAVPLGAPGSYRVLDAVDMLLAEGRPSSHLSPVLARLGIHYLVLRNDLDSVGSGGEPPWIVRASLVGSPGISRSVGFGAVDAGSAVEVFTVSGTGAAVSALPVSSTVAVSGGSEATVGLASALTNHRAAVLDQDVTGVATVGGVVVTDTGRRRSLNFGYSNPHPHLSTDGTALFDVAPDLARYSPTLPAYADAGRPAAQLGPTTPSGEQTVSAVAGLKRIAASSSAADPFSPNYRGIADRPESAFDGDASTAWVSADGAADGSWISARFARSINVPIVHARFVDDTAVGPSVAEVEVRTDAGTRLDPVQRGSGMQPLPLPTGATSTLRITVEQVRGRSADAEAGVSEIAIPGLTPSPELITARSFPREVVGLPTAIELDRTAGDRSACVPTPNSAVCSSTLAHAGEEVVPYVRHLRAPGPVGGSAIVTVRATDPRLGLAGALARSAGVAATASSVSVPAVADGPFAVVDGDPTTSWLPAASDATPRLSLHFARPVAAHTLTLVGDLAAAGSVVLAVGGRVVNLRAVSSRAQPVDVSGRNWVLTLPRAASTAATSTDPLSLASIQIDSDSFSPASVTVGCDSGVSVSVDDVSVPLSVTASMRQVMTGAEVQASACTPPPKLAAGDHIVRFHDGGGWQIANVGLGLAQLPVAADRAVRVRSTTATRIAVHVASGPNAYLQLTQSFNRGWQASCAGASLTPARLDGWRQGFLVRASVNPCDVVISFHPESWQPIALSVGAAGIVALVMLAVLPERARPPREPGGRESAASRLRQVRDRAARAGGLIRRVVPVVIAGAAGWFAAGPFAAVAAVVVSLLPARTEWVIAGAGMAAAGVSGVLAPTSSAAAFSAVVAMAALLSAAVRPIRPEPTRLRDRVVPPHPGAPTAGSVARRRTS